MAHSQMHSCGGASFTVYGKVEAFPEVLLLFYNEGKHECFLVTKLSALRFHISANPMISMHHMRSSHSQEL